MAYTLLTKIVKNLRTGAAHARHLRPLLEPDFAATLLKRVILAAYAWHLISAPTTQILIDHFALWSA